MVEMAEQATRDEVLEAARSLDREEGFTREEVAAKLGVEVAAMRPSWKAAKEAGQLQKVGSKGDKRLFRLADQ